MRETMIRQKPLHSQPQEHITGTRMTIMDNVGRVLFEGWLSEAAWNNRRLGWPDDPDHVTRVTLVRGGVPVASRLVYRGEGPTASERNAAGLPPSEWGFPPIRMEFGPAPQPTDYWRTTAPQPGAKGINGLGSDDDGEEEERRVTRRAAKMATEMLDSYLPSIEDHDDRADQNLFAAQTLIEQGSCAEAFESITMATEEMSISASIREMTNQPDDYSGLDVQRKEVEQQFIQKCIIKRKRR